MLATLILSFPLSSSLLVPIETIESWRIHKNDAVFFGCLFFFLFYFIFIFQISNRFFYCKKVKFLGPLSNLPQNCFGKWAYLIVEEPQILAQYPWLNWILRSRTDQNGSPCPFQAWFRKSVNLSKNWQLCERKKINQPLWSRRSAVAPQMLQSGLKRIRKSPGKTHKPEPPWNIFPSSLLSLSVGTSDHAAKLQFCLSELPIQLK